MVILDVVDCLWSTWSTDCIQTDETMHAKSATLRNRYVLNVHAITELIPILLSFAVRILSHALVPYVHLCQAHLCNGKRIRQVCNYRSMRVFGVQFIWCFF